MGSLVILVTAGGHTILRLPFNHTESYWLSFNIFIGMLLMFAVLSLFLRPSVK